MVTLIFLGGCVWVMYVYVCDASTHKVGRQPGDYIIVIILIFYGLTYCKSTNFGVLLYLANCVFSLILVASKYVIVR